MNLHFFTYLINFFSIEIYFKYNMYILFIFKFIQFHSHFLKSIHAFGKQKNQKGNNINIYTSNLIISYIESLFIIFFSHFFVRLSLYLPRVLLCRYKYVCMYAYVFIVNEFWTSYVIFQADISTFIFKMRLFCKFWAWSLSFIALNLVVERKGL